MVPLGSEINIYYPDDITPKGFKWLKDRCGDDTLEHFFNSKLTCKYREDLKLIMVEDGFRTGQSAKDPPTLEWEIPLFTNPRTTKPTDAFNATIVDKSGNTIYYWDSTTAPVLSLAKGATPLAISYTRDSTVNGAYTKYTFTIKNNMVYEEGNYVKITVPSQMTLSADSECAGFFGFATATCTVSTSLTYVIFKITFPDSRRRMLAAGDSG